MPLGSSPSTETQPPRQRPDPLLALRARGTLLPERAVNAAPALLTPLFQWPLSSMPSSSASPAVDSSLLAVHGLGAESQQGQSMTQWTYCVS